MRGEFHLLSNNLAIRALIQDMGDVGQLLSEGTQICTGPPPLRLLLPSRYYVFQDVFSQISP